MTDQDDIRRAMERELALDEARKASAPVKFSSDNVKEPPGTRRVTGGGIIDRVNNFFGGISTRVEQQRAEFYSPTIIEADQNSAPTTRLGKIREKFVRAAHSVSHNRLADMVFRNPVARAVQRPFGLLEQAVHYVRYPLGLPGDRENAYTRITINADFYTRATAAAVLTPILHSLGKGFGEAGDLMFDPSRDRMQSLKQNKRSLYWALKTTGFMWSFGGKQTLGALYNYCCCDKPPSGKRHFSPLQVANSAMFGAFMWYAGAPLAAFAAIGPVYYYGSWATINDVYIPSAGVFLSQTFEKGAQAGQVFAARDEIWTVQGKVFDQKSQQVEEVRFDLDSNLYFWFYEDAWRPDLAADKMNSHSANGVKCDVEVTGIYAKMPRGIRFIAKWVNVRPEIIRVRECEQLTDVPEFLKRIQLPNHEGSSSRPEITKVAPSHALQPK